MLKQNLYFIKAYLLLIVLISCFLISCTKTSETQVSNSTIKGDFSFTIYDSLLVQHKGNIQLMDISPNGESYLLLDQNNANILISNPEGEILYKISQLENDEGKYVKDRNGKATFISNEEFIILTTKAVHKYNVSGTLLTSWKPKFHPYSSSITPSKQNTLLYQNQVFLRMDGRSRQYGEGIEFQQKATTLEVLNLEENTFTPIIPFPSTSKLRSDKMVFSAIERSPVFSLSQDSLYVAFSNEAKLHAYAIPHLDTPVYSRDIPFPLFIEAKGSEGVMISSLKPRDFFRGTIHNIIPMGNGKFIVDYESGLTDEEAEQAINEGGPQVNDILRATDKMNRKAMVVFDGKAISTPIGKPNHLGSLNKFISSQEIWFSSNAGHAGNDYSVVYKTRLTHTN